MFFSGEYSSLLNQSAGRSQVTAISALQRDISHIRKLLQQAFEGFYIVASFEGLLNFIFEFLYCSHGPDFTQLYGK